MQPLVAKLLTKLPRGSQIHNLATTDVALARPSRSARTSFGHGQLARHVLSSFITELHCVPVVRRSYFELRQILNRLFKAPPRDKRVIRRPSDTTNELVSKRRGTDP